MSDDSGVRMVRAVVTASTPRPRRRFITASATGAAALTLGIPADTMAAEHLAQTGWFASSNPGAPAGTEPLGSESDSSEWIDTSASYYVGFAVGKGSRSMRASQSRTSAAVTSGCSRCTLCPAASRTTKLPRG